LLVVYLSQREEADHNTGHGPGEKPQEMAPDSVAAIPNYRHQIADDQEREKRACGDPGGQNDREKRDEDGVEAR
jgi:hypothetical protein